MIGNKIVDKITSSGKSKHNEEKDETNEVEEIYIPSEKRQQIIDDLIWRNGETYNNNKQIRFKTSLLRSDLCDYSIAYIVLKGIITVNATDGPNNIRDKETDHFKNKWCINRKCRRFRHCNANVQFA